MYVCIASKLNCACMSLCVYIHCYRPSEMQYVFPNLFTSANTSTAFQQDYPVTTLYSTIDIIGNSSSRPPTSSLANSSSRPPIFSPRIEYGRRHSRNMCSINFSPTSGRKFSRSVVIMLGNDVIPRGVQRKTAL